MSHLAEGSQDMYAYYRYLELRAATWGLDVIAVGEARYGPRTEGWFAIVGDGAHTWTSSRHANKAEALEAAIDLAQAQKRRET